jgi:hypothetical protein
LGKNQIVTRDGIIAYDKSEARMITALALEAMPVLCDDALTEENDELSELWLVLSTTDRCIMVFCFDVAGIL